MAENGYKYIGKPRPMNDGAEKVSGAITYVADITVPRMTYGRPVLSPYANAKIVEIDRADAEQMPGVVAVLVGQDLPTRDRTISSRNSAILAIDTVHWVGQPVVLVVAETEQQAADAAEMVFIDYEPLTPVVDVLKAIEMDSAQVWPKGLPGAGDGLEDLHGEQVASDGSSAEKLNNVLDESHFVRGDVDAAFAMSDVVIEQRFHSKAVHQLYLEPYAALAVPGPMGKSLTVYASTQGQFGVRAQLAGMLGLSLNKVVVEAVGIGGGFGAKYGVLEPLAASAAMALRLPVRVVLSRSEDMLATTPAPNIVFDVKTGATKDGKLTAIDARVLTDNGAFKFTHGGMISFTLGGNYKCANVKIDAYEIATNKAPIGAYRAPGIPQAAFAIESMIDELAHAIGMSPLAFRQNNAVEAGDMMGNNRPWPSVGMTEVLDRLAEHPIMSAELGENEGVGIALAGWPTGVSNSEALCRVDADGSVNVQTGNVDVSGNNSTFVLIAAEILGVDPSNVSVENTNTSGAFAPGSGGSQVTYSVAGSIKSSAESARAKLLEVASDHFEASAADIELVDGEARVRGVPDKAVTIGQLVGIARSKREGVGSIVGEGTSSIKEHAPAFTVHAIKVHVEPETGIVTPLDYVAVQDVGFALNPTMVEGQMLGGMVQGLGIGLHEALVYDEEGQLLSGTLLDYGMPRIDQAPPMEALHINNPSPHGPYGARGIGEPPITAGPGALANAIRNATGVRITETPLRQEVVWRALNA